MHFSYAIATKPINEDCREFAVSFRPFLQLATLAAIPNKPVCAYLHRPPWTCGSPAVTWPKVEFPGVLWDPPQGARERQRIAVFECPSGGIAGHNRHKVVGARIDAFTKSDPVEYTWLCAASLSVEAIRESLERLGRAILEQVGGYITGGFAVVPFGGAQSIPASGKRRTLDRRIKA